MTAILARAIRLAGPASPDADRVNDLLTLYSQPEPPHCLSETLTQLAIDLFTSASQTWSRTPSSIDRAFTCTMELSRLESMTPVADETFAAYLGSLPALGGDEDADQKETALPAPTDAGVFAARRSQAQSGFYKLSQGTKETSAPLAVVEPNWNVHVRAIEWYMSYTGCARFDLVDKYLAPAGPDRGALLAEQLEHLQGAFAAYAHEAERCGDTRTWRECFLELDRLRLAELQRSSELYDDDGVNASTIGEALSVIKRRVDERSSECLQAAPRTAVVHAADDEDRDDRDDHKSVRFARGSQEEPSGQDEAKDDVADLALDDPGVRDSSAPAFDLPSLPQHWAPEAKPGSGSWSSSAEERRWHTFRAQLRTSMPTRELKNQHTFERAAELLKFLRQRGETLKDIDMMEALVAKYNPEYLLEVARQLEHVPR